MKSIQYPPLYSSIDMIFSNLSKIGDVHGGCYSNLDFCAYVTCSGTEKTTIEKAYTFMSEFKPILYSLSDINREA